MLPPIAAVLVRQAADDLATSALPHAPVRADRTRRRVAVRSGAWRRNGA